MSRRSDLRAVVWDISGGRCEHPLRLVVEGSDEVIAVGRCPVPAAQMAHIVPRGMGHTGYRDVLTNVMAACPIHAASTDNLTSPEWGHVQGWRHVAGVHLAGEPLMTKRQALAHYVNRRRRREGVDLEASDAR